MLMAIVTKWQYKHANPGHMVPIPNHSATL